MPQSDRTRSRFSCCAARINCFRVFPRKNKNEKQRRSRQHDSLGESQKGCKAAHSGVVIGDYCRVIDLFASCLRSCLCATLYRAQTFDFSYFPSITRRLTLAGESAKLRNCFQPSLIRMQMAKIFSSKAQKTLNAHTFFTLAMAVNFYCN